MIDMSSPEHAAALALTQPSGRRDSTPPLAEYERLLPQARAAVLGRLWGALWRETPAGLTRSGTELVHDSGRRLSAPAGAAEPFAPYPPDLAVRIDDREVRDPLALVPFLPETRRRDLVAAELGESVGNLGVALAVADQRRGNRLFGPGQNPLGVAAGQARSDPNASPLAFFEQLVTDGHPLHPCCRSRRGFTPHDMARYAPEWRKVVHVPFVAVRRDRLVTAGADLTDRLQAEYPRMPAVPSGYGLIPVHPWQLENVLPVRHAEAFEEGVLVRILEAMPTRALMSTRTMAPLPRGSSHVKTALDVAITSAIRTVSPAATVNGPTLSLVLAGIVDREGFDRFWVLAEPAAAGYVGPDGPDRSLAAVLRTSPERHADSHLDEVALPVSALSARSPVADHPLLVHALDNDPVRWLTEYCDLLVPPMLTLLTRWGVALEAHGQNTLVVLRKGRPLRVLYRDFGGVRVSPARLARHGITAPPLAGDVPTDDPDELRTKLASSMVLTQLGELVATLSRCTAGSPGTYWEVVARSCRRAYERLRGEPTAAEDEAALFAPTLPMKALLSMRLADDPLVERWVQVPNPLAGTR